MNKKYSSMVLSSFLSVLFQTDALAACTITSTNPLPMAFTYDSLSGAASTSTATIRIRCAPPTSGTVGISAGNSGNTRQRQMKSATSTDLLKYNLYQNAANTLIWGTTGTDLVSFPSGVNTALVIYGKIPASQFVTVGAYTDSNLTITVNYI